MTGSSPGSPLMTGSEYSLQPAKDAKGAPTNTMSFEEAPSHPH